MIDYVQWCFFGNAQWWVFSLLVTGNQAVVSRESEYILYHIKKLCLATVLKACTINIIPNINATAHYFMHVLITNQLIENSYNSRKIFFIYTCKNALIIFNSSWPVKTSKERMRFNVPCSIHTTACNEQGKKCVHTSGVYPYLTVPLDSLAITVQQIQFMFMLTKAALTWVSKDRASTDAVVGISNSQWLLNPPGWHEVTGYIIIHTRWMHSIEWTSLFQIYSVVQLKCMCK